MRRLARWISEGMCKNFTRDCHERIRSLLPAVAAHRLRSLRYCFTLGMLPRWTCVCVFPATSWRKGCDSHFLPTSGTKNPSLHGHKKASSCTRGRICSHGIALHMCALITLQGYIYTSDCQTSQRGFFCTSVYALVHTARTYN